MRKKRLLWRLFPSYLLITLISLGAATWYSAHSWRQFYLKETSRDLEARARLVETQVAGPVTEAAGVRIDTICKHLGQMTATRLTVILPSGKVLGDSEEDPNLMDNHGDRPEVQEALAGRVGVKTRFSYTVQKNLMYVAIPLRGEQGRVAGVVRASLPVQAIEQALRRVYFQVSLGGLVIALLAGILSIAVARRLNRPLEEMRRGAERFAQGNLTRKVPVPDTEELGSLAEALNHMAAQLDEHIRTILKQRQEQEAVLAGMVEGVVAVDSDCRLITLNRAAAQLLQVEDRDVQHRPLQEVVANPELVGFASRALASGQPLERELVLDGGGRILHVLGTPLKDPDGRTAGVVIVLHDVTRLKRLENTRREFVANVAHELKTPVTSIKGFTETLLEGALQDPEKAQEFLRIMARQADRLQAIIADLLSLSRLEEVAGKGRVQLTAGPLKAVLEAALQVCEARAAAKNITITLTCLEDLRARINAPLLEQALVNLIDNAVKYSDPGKMVTVEARREGGEVVIAVKDQGVGIAREHRDRLFERFYRVDPSRSRKVGGTGLGLAIVKHIVQAHGGRVSVQSALGQGSVFTLHLAAA